MDIRSESIIRRLFNELSNKYDEWYEKPENKALYEAELKALRSLRGRGLAVEIGVGSGRFACKMGIQIGVDISIKLLEKAKKRGILSVLADASNLPFKSNSFDEAYLIFTICFLTKAEKALIEAKRTLKKNGKLIIAFIPKESPLGMKYLEKAKNGHPFYSKAKFYSFKEILKLASKHGFELERIVSALGPKIEDLTDRYDPKYSFCCIKLKRKQ